MKQCPCGKPAEYHVHLEESDDEVSVRDACGECSLTIMRDWRWRTRLPALRTRIERGPRKL